MCRKTGVTACCRRSAFYGKRRNARMPSIGVVSTFGAGFLSNLINVQKPSAGTIHVVAPALRDQVENVRFHPIAYQVGRGGLAQVLNQVVSQARMAFRLVRLAGKVDLWVFLGCDVFLLPVLVARLMRGRVLLTLLGSLEREAKFKRNALNPVQVLLKRANCALSNRIAVYSDSLVREWGLERYRGKLIIAQSLFLDFDLFRIEKPLSKRGKVVGYVGRLSAEKGVWNVVRAMPLVTQVEPDVKFLLVGDGPLRDQVMKFIRTEGLEGKVIMAGTVPHAEVPRYMNEMRLHVLASATEGMPAAVLEAMACGTPVLTTRAGAIGDVVEDGRTGLIMRGDSPECIADTVIRALHQTNLDAITAAARELVERDFCLDAARERYRRVIAMALAGAA